MDAQQQSSSAVKDLIVINNDRCEGYRTAAKETEDPELKTLFNEFSTQSEGFANELRRFAGEDQPKSDETKATGKLYRVWMDIKAAITAKDRKAILSSCEFGEDVAKKHYEEVLMHSDGVPPEALEIIRRQQTSILRGHDTVKALRDAAK
jgi:uncharacterized protein (TIGR02284 family)